MHPGWLARLSRSLLALLLLACFAPATGPTARAASDEAEAAVAGRLGGPLETFIARYGEPVADNAATGPLYAIEGYGYFTVHVEGENAYLGRSENGAPIYQGQEPSARLDRISASSPRDADRSATEPDPADWTLADAGERVAELLPVDATLSDWTESADGQRTATCESAALAEIYADGPAVRCYIVLIMSGPETVSYATLLLSRYAGTGNEEADAEASPCDGAVDWIRAAGDRLTEIQSLIGQVAAIDETDPAAAETLRDIAATFRELAAEQRETAVPGVAAQASYYLIQALTTYAKAIEMAADGLEQRDQELVDQAVKTFDQAGSHVVNVTAEIEAASDACALQLGAPAPATPEP